MSSKSESTLKHTFMGPVQTITTESEFIETTIIFTQQELIELAQYKEYTLVHKIPVQLEERQ